MRYEDFKAAFDEALRESKLRMIGLSGDETLDLGTLDRNYEVHVEPFGGSDAEPFFVAASISFRWDSLSTARTNTREEDMLTELFGREGSKRKTEKPWLRLDIKLNASLMDGQEIPMPPKRAWAAWGEEVMGRLEEVEPLTPGEKVRKNKAGNLEVLAWQGEPKVELICDADGDLRLRAVSISAMQIMHTPRIFDDPKKEDEKPHDDLREMFHRVRASLMAWMQALDHLKNVAPARPKADDPLRH